MVVACCSFSLGRHSVREGGRNDGREKTHGSLSMILGKLLVSISYIFIYVYK